MLNDDSQHSNDATIDRAAVALHIPLLSAAIGAFGVEAPSSDTPEATASSFVLRSPVRVGMIFAGNLGAQLLQAIILGLCLRAFGHHATMAELILVNSIADLLAGFMPVPGGMGVAEAAYTAGLVALGVPNAAAMSTAIAFRAITYFLPPVWGAIALRWLRQHSFI